jgi:hypothetical protein
MDGQWLRDLAGVFYVGMNRMVSSNGDFINWCDDCQEEVNYCSTCSRSDIYFVLNLDEMGGEYYCEHCGPPEHEYIHYYSLKPDPQFHGSPDTAHGAYFGIELETECLGEAHRREMAEMWYGNSKGESDFYLKEDGSLYNGIEVVSHPRSLASWREYCANEFARILAEMSRSKVKAWRAGSCGLHVHVSRDAFEDTSHLERFALLFNRNQAQAQKFARRESGYARFDNEVSVIRKVRGDYDADHFDAVNVGGNDGETVEVRIFRPSLAVARIMGSIECVAAALEFTRDLEIEKVWGGALEWSNFSEYLRGEGYTYAALIDANKNFVVSPTLEGSADYSSSSFEMRETVCA